MGGENKLSYSDFMNSLAKKVSAGDKVTIDYEGTLDSGEVFDSTKHGDHSHPFTFTAGAGEVIPGFDKGVLGMKEGEEKKITIPPNEAYGEYDASLRQEIPREAVPSEKEPKPGMMLVMEMPEGYRVPVQIVAVSEKVITIDLNHLLAGKNLHFSIKVLSIESKK